MTRREPARIAWDAFVAIEKLTEATALLRRRGVADAVAAQIRSHPLIGLTFVVAADEARRLVDQALPDEEVSRGE